MNTSIQETIPAWSGGEKFIFRSICIFFPLYILPFPISSIPFLKGWNNIISSGWDEWWHLIVPWVGDHIVHLPATITTFSNGSGDTTYDYVLLFTFLLLSLLAAAGWTLFDRKRTHYAAAYSGLRVYVRYFLAYILFSYGFSKVFYLQMMPPTLYELIQPFGDKSPMGLAWSYVGYSKAFSVITGLAEITGGTLLLFRKTVTLGALFNLFVLGNVVIMNFCFDVPVKLYSSMLWTMTLFLLLPDVSRLVHTLVLNKSAPPVQPVYYLQGKWRMAATSIKWLFFMYVIWMNISRNIGRQASIGVNRVKPPLYGLYNISSFVRNNDTLPLLIDEPGLWRNLVIEFKKNAVVKFANDSMERYLFVVDTTQHAVTMSPFFDRKKTSTLWYTQRDSLLILQGRLNNDSVNIQLKRMDASKFRLINRGFHWINERPYHY